MVPQRPEHAAGEDHQLWQQRRVSGMRTAPGPDQQCSADEADDQSGHAACAGMVLAPASEAEQHDPQGTGGIQQRAGVGLHRLHGPDLQPVAQGNAQQRQHQQVAPLASERSQPEAAPQRDGRQSGARDDEAQAAEQQRRQVEYADPRRDVARAPDDVDRGEAEHQHAPLARGFVHSRGLTQRLSQGERTASSSAPPAPYSNMRMK